MKGGIFGHFGRRGTGAKAGSLRLSPSPAGPMLGTNQKQQFHSWGDHHAPHSAARGPKPFCIRTPADGRRAGADRRADRASQFRRRRRDGRRAGQRQEGRLHHHHHRRQRQGRPLQLPGRQARARPVCAPHPRHRLRSRQSQEHRGRGAEDHHGRSQAPQDRRPRGADVERRMDQQHPRQRSAQGRFPQLRRLPHARARHALDAQRRGVPQYHAAADAELREPKHPAAPAASQSRAADGGARRFTRADLQVDGGLSRDRQSQLEAAVELPARSDAAAGRPRHARDLHRIRPAARHHRAP